MKARLLLVGLIPILFASCFTPRAMMNVPEGFSVYRESEHLRMVSPEGMRIRARVVENDPPQSLEFWRTALVEHMVDSGYTAVDEGEIAGSGAASDGVWMEWIAPVNGEDWIYLNALRVRDDLLVFVESAAELELYQLHRSAIHSVLGTLGVE